MSFREVSPYILRYGQILLVIGFLAFIGWDQYKKYVIQKDLFLEILQIQEKTISHIILNKGYNPYTSERCLTLRGKDDIQVIVDSLQRVAREAAPLPLNPQLQFQLVMVDSDGLQTDVLGTIYEEYPKDVYLERNLWKRTGEKTYSYQPQHDLYWPEIGPWIQGKMKDAIKGYCKHQN